MCLISVVAQFVVPMKSLVRKCIGYTFTLFLHTIKSGWSQWAAMAACHCCSWWNWWSILCGLDSGPIDEKEKLRPEELNQQNIEALVAESNLVRHSLQCMFVETETLLRNMFLISHAWYYWNRWFYTQWSCKISFFNHCSVLWSGCIGEFGGW